MTEVKAIRVRKLRESSFMFQAGQFCCGFKNIWIRMDVEIFVSGTGKLRVQKYPDSYRQDLCNEPR